MAKNINTILKLKDEFSKTIKTASKNTMSFDQKVKLTTNSIRKMGNTIKSATMTGVKNIAKIGLAMGGVAVGVGLKEAMDLQGYRTQLDTATKDTVKAADIMKYSIRLANKTPFEGGQVVEAAAKFEAMGMSAKEWLTATGDMAAGTNKDIIQATEAIIDAQMGEMERLKEFGIKKEHIQRYANDKMNKLQIINNKGQIVNEKAFQSALMGLMKERYAGGMEAQSKTLKGSWSTITGIVKSSLANVMGVTEEGTLRAGSAVDIISSKFKDWGQTLIEMQESGEMDKIAEQAANLTQKGFQGLNSGIDWFIENKDEFMSAAKGMLIFFATAKTMSGVVSIVTGLKMAWEGIPVLIAGAKGAMALATANPVVLAIAGVAAAVYLLATNWDSVTKFADRALKKMAQLRDMSFPEMRASAGQSYAFRQKAGDAYVNSYKSGLDVHRKMSGASEYATGTTFHPGGPARINENRRGEIVDLPSGTRVIPHDISKKMGGGNNVSVQVIIQGNVVGNQEFVDDMAEQTARKIVLAIENC